VRALPRGTWEFLHPFGLFEAESFGDRDDAFALALLTYELLCLEMPYWRGGPLDRQLARVLATPDELDGLQDFCDAHGVRMPAHLPAHLPAPARVPVMPALHACTATMTQSKPQRLRCMHPRSTRHVIVSQR
jgi:hypothetical protein